MAKISIKTKISCLNAVKKVQGMTVAAAARMFSIGERTIRRWLHNDLEIYEKTAVKKKGRKSKISPTIASAILQWVKKRNLAYEPVTNEDIKNYVFSINGPVLTQQQVSRFMLRNGYRSHKAQKRPIQRTRETYNQELSEFRATWKTFDASNYIVMDESGIWEDSVVLRSYSPIGEPNPFIKSPGVGKRDTVVAALRGNGDKLPLFYIAHQRAKTGDILFLDRLSSHMTKQVQQKLITIGVGVVYFPAKTAPDLSPLDNFFFPSLQE